MHWLVFILISSLTSVWGQAQSGSGTSGLPPMPSLNLSNSPMAQFRVWLELTPSEREVVLASKSEKQRVILRAKLREYSALPLAEREQRMQLVEFHWLTKSLMNLPPARRDASLANTPASWRQLLESRLNQWDQLTPEVQKEVMESEMVVTSFVGLAQAGTEAQRAWLQTFTAEDQQRIQARIELWKQMSTDERQRLSTRIHHYFDLPPSEQQKGLGALTEPERQQMEVTLQAFWNLPVAQRQACIDSFGKFAILNETERRQFFKNAERWQTMSQQDRTTWRNLVKNLPPMPPMPPSLQFPPMPNGIKPQTAPAQLTASNTVVAPL